MLGIEGDPNILSLLTIEFENDELTIAASLTPDLEQEKPLEIVISVPLQFIPNVSVTHVSAFMSWANLDEVKVQAAGTESCLLGKVHVLDGVFADHSALRASDVNGNAKVTLSGRSKASLPKFWGGLAVNATECSQISVKGSFTHIAAELLHSATVTTSGAITGDLSVQDGTDLNGFQHSGDVYGRSYGVAKLG